MPVHELARPRVTRPSAFDLLVAAAFVVLTIAEAVARPEAREPWQVAVALLGVAGLALRRMHPVPVATLLVLSDLLSDPDAQFSTVLALVIAAYTVGFEVPGRARYVGLAVIVLPFLGVSLADTFEPSDLAAAMMFLIGPWAVGIASAGRALHTAEALARADRVEREHEMRAAEAAAAERTRIARELHDVVSHSLSVITIQTQALRRSSPDAATRGGLAELESVAREAMAEMRRLFGVLRTDGDTPELDPQPGLGDLPRLVRRADSSSTRVTLTVAGNPVPISPGLDLTAYRIVQEAVTNATRHARATRVDVALTWTPQQLRLRVTDDGAGTSSTAGDGSGHGLVGIRERVALYGGDVRVDTAPDRGFELTATLPITVAEAVR